MDITGRKRAEREVRRLAALVESSGDAILGKRSDQLMTLNPKTIGQNVLAAQALMEMEENSPRPITCLFVLDNARKPVGIIHLHDILKTGI